jgi:hypothetical protein
MQWYEPPSTIRILRTAEGMQVALRLVKDAELLKARQADTRDDHYATVAPLVTSNSVVVPPVLPVPAPA